MDKANIEINAFDYAAEESKKGFQATISSQLELHSHLQAKYITALQNNKSGVFIESEEMKHILQWILDIAGSQMGHYLVLDGTNRKTNKLFRCAMKIQERQPQTPSLRKLLA